MYARRLAWLIVVLSMLLLPLFANGCGADNTDADKTFSKNTVGPGALHDFSGHITSSGTWKTF